MIDAIDYEIPHSQQPVVSIGVDLVRVHELVSDQLMPLAALELHLLFEELVLVLKTAFLLVLDLLFVRLVESLLVALLVRHRVVRKLTRNPRHRSDIATHALHAKEP